MRTSKLKELISTLTPSQKRALLKELQTPGPEVNQYQTLRSEMVAERPKCLYCGHDKVVKFGSYNGSRRFRCKHPECLRTFNEVSGSSIHHIQKKDKWNDFIELLLQNKTIMEISKELKLSTKTVFDWRHKVLFSLDKVFTKQFRGIVEVDDIFLPFNQKGRKKDRIKNTQKSRTGFSKKKASIMIVVDRDYTLDMRLARKGQLTDKSIMKVMPIDRLNNQRNVICSDESHTIKKYFRNNEFKHYTINATKKQRVKRVEGEVYHVQRANQLAADFRRWLNGNFISVSTKYLQNYLNLYKMEQILAGIDAKELELLKFSLAAADTWTKKKDVEENYQKFLKI